MPSPLLKRKPPQSIVLVYRYFNKEGAHTFTIDKIPGLVIMDWSLRNAYDNAVGGMQSLAQLNFGIQYQVLDDFEAFEKTKKVRCELMVIH